MAQIVQVFGTSHSPTLNSPAEEQLHHAKVDKGLSHWKRELLDWQGNPASYEKILAQADPAIAGQITPEIIEERTERCQADIQKLGAAIEAAELDALVIIGDDQHEVFSDANMPAILIYWGETITNKVLTMSDDVPDWWRRARSQYYEPEQPRDYPVDNELGLHLIEYLLDRDFDVSQSRELSGDHGEGHAYGFFHRRLMTGPEDLPIVPVALNTYYPPNQPRPKRCFELGRKIREAVEDWEEDARVGVLASGGLSHFTIDEELDTGVLDACANKDVDHLTSIPLNLLNSGNSEIRNWITAAGAAEHLELTWRDYVPCYRSEAGTGCGMAFAVWK